MSLPSAAVAQMVEYILGKDGVMGSNPVSSICLLDLQKRMNNNRKIIVNYFK